MDEQIAELQKQLTDLHHKSEIILETAETEKREVSKEEQETLDKLETTFDQTKAGLQRAKVKSQGDHLHTSVGRVVEPEPFEPQARSIVQVGEERVLGDKKKWGWRNLGEYCLAVRQHETEGVTDRRLQLRAATTFGQELVGADGGFAVPPDFRDTILVKVTGEQSLMGFTNQVQTSSNGITIPTDETTPWGTSGIFAEWEGEGDTYAQRKPNLKQLNIKANKLIVFAPMTDELLEDTTALGQYVTTKAAAAINFKINDGIINGTGAGQPAGILSSAALISITKANGQDNDSVVGENIINMWARLFVTNPSSVVWLINQDTLPELMTMSIPGQSEAGANQATWGFPLWVPPRGESPFSTLLGRPVIVTQACQTLGDVGDVILADMSQYMTVIKSGGMRTDSSIHFYFDSGHTAFRVTMRIGGAPEWSGTISPFDGSNTLSPFVAIAERT